MIAAQSEASALRNANLDPTRERNYLRSSIVASRALAASSAPAMSSV